jgi:SWIM zinc finger
MSRPRKPFGATHPGRLPATMVKVLAAEMSDPSRLRRGKQYAKDGSVLDIIIDPGVVTCEVQGSRSMPYIATIEVTQGDGMPLRRDVTCTCSCPDDDNWDDYACKHVIAGLFTLSNEFLVEPELLDVWRNHGAGATPTASDPNVPVDDTAPTPSRGTRRHLSVVRDTDDGDTNERNVGRDRLMSAFVDPLRDVLRLQPGAALPEIPVLEPADLALPRDRDLAAAIRDALRNVRVDWD